MLTIGVLNVQRCKVKTIRSRDRFKPFNDPILGEFKMTDLNKFDLDELEYKHTFTNPESDKVFDLNDLEEESASAFAFSKTKKSKTKKSKTKK